MYMYKVIDLFLHATVLNILFKFIPRKGLALGHNDKDYSPLYQ